MHGSDVWRDRASIGQALYRRAIKSGNRHNQAMTYILWVYRNIDSPFTLDAPVVMIDPKEHQYDQWDQNNHNPRPFQKFLLVAYQPHNHLLQPPPPFTNHSTQ